MKLELERVKHWNLQFDEPVRDSKHDRKKIPENQLEKRASFILEETKETLDALKKKDFVEVLDGLADLGFVCAGTVLECGLELKHSHYVKAAERSMMSVVEKLEAALTKRHWEKVETLLCELEFLYRGIGAVFGLPYTAAFEEVFNSNMSKKTKDGIVIRNEKGKIMKPDTFQKPDIAGIMSKKGWHKHKANVE